MSDQVDPTWESTRDLNGHGARSPDRQPRWPCPEETCLKTRPPVETRTQQHRAGSSLGVRQRLLGGREAETISPVGLGSKGHG